MEETRKPADTKEPAIKREEILFLPDDNFNAKLGNLGIEKFRDSGIKG